MLNALANALRLNDVEREYLFGLARTASANTRARTGQKTTETGVRESVQRVLDSMSIPAVAWNARQDVVAANLMGRALYSPQFESDRPNFSRFIFLDPRAKDYYVEWPMIRRYNAAMLRLNAGRDPLDADLTALIGELSTLSPEFRANWAEPRHLQRGRGQRIRRKVRAPGQLGRHQ
ncbi:hypothetical protein R5O87_01830 [Arthrobacter globiformis]|uniref:MmyB family transcriptional regulator n=1 Tax=Arthrobacter globiformis TaxID=1665 RepID=UPI00397CA270